MSDPYSFEYDSYFNRIRLEFGMSIPLTPRRFLTVMRPEGLPAPLQRAAEAMYDAKTDDEAKAAAHEYLILSEEWL